MATVTFKKQTALSGLAAVGNPYSDVDCKLRKKVFGAIGAPNWQTKDNCWTIRIVIEKPEPDDNPNCSWKWIRFAKRFVDEAEARVWLLQNIDAIQEKYTLHFLD